MTRPPTIPRVAVVTGGTGGVGRATVRELADRGWDVAILARGEAGLKAAVAEVEARGRRGLAVPTDVAEHDQVEAAAARVEDELGPIDCWINNTMTTVFGRVEDLQAEEIERATNVTYLGQVHGALAALRRMRPRNRGTIIFVGSALAYRGIPLQSAYCAAKFAVRGFYESLRTELINADSQVRVTTVHLPAVNTTQFGWGRAKVDRHPQPVPPIYQPEVAAAAIVDAAETAPRQKILGSWNWLLVQVAQTMPGVGDHFMARSGVSGQLTDIPIADDRADNLFEPVDQDRDFGAHGIFDDRASGVRTPAFLKQLPDQAKTFALAARARFEEVRARRAA
jgi:NAD(P)-dependent dehydrogenase (short-subunit alcohol dehydrogenase family)